MLDLGEGYQSDVQTDNRSVILYLSLGSNIDSTAADDYTHFEGDILPMSNVNQIVDANYSMTNLLATFEGEGIPTATSYGVVVPPLEETAYPPEVGVWSSDISDSDGNLGYEFTIHLSQAHSSGFTVYTDGPSITSGYIDFILGGVSTRQEMMCTKGSAWVSEMMEYDAIKVHVDTIDAPFMHLRIVEIEFGASVTLTRDNLGGEVTCIHELDPLELSMPLHELDFSIMNVEGGFDVDSPSGEFDDILPRAPVAVSVTVEGDSGNHTVQMGTFHVAVKETQGNFLSITAYDARWLLSETYASWTVTASTSLGEQLEALLNENAVPHLVDTALFDVFMEKDHTFDDDTSLLDDMLRIQQAYGVYFIPRRDGSIEVTQTYPADSYGSVDVNGVYQWPSPVQFRLYNVIEIQYGEGTTKQSHVVDLRSDSTESRSVLKITNPLILTQARAQTLANRILGRMYTSMVELDWIGDPAMDLYDSVAMPGRWTQDAPVEYKAVRMETTYNGGLRVVARGVR